MLKLATDPVFHLDTPAPNNDSIRDYQLYSYNAEQPNSRSRIEL
jgi:hypothetical protein